MLLQLAKEGSPGATLLSEKIAVAIHEIWRSTRIMEPFVRVEKITIEQYWIMRFLYEKGASRVKDIALKIGITSSPVTISVKRLESRGFVKRKRSTDDERVVTVCLTQHGRDVFESWRKKRQNLLSGVFECLSMREKRELLELVSKVNSSIFEKKGAGTALPVLES